ncbi:MAG: hypothetical protein ACXWGZ_10755, partial [Candidatus Aminicenantales bacterium]
MAHTLRPRFPATLLLAFFIAGLLPGLALEPPTKEQIARYKLDGTLAARVAQAKALGNHKIPQRMR